MTLPACLACPTPETLSIGWFRTVGTRRNIQDVPPKADVCLRVQGLRSPFHVVGVVVKSFERALLAQHRECGTDQQLLQDRVRVRLQDFHQRVGNGGAVPQRHE